MFLRQSLEARLVAVHVDGKSFTAGLTIAAPLLKELKKIDDKALLVEVGGLVDRWLVPGRDQHIIPEFLWE